MQVVFKKSLPEESATLSDIAIRSKAHWGYPAEKLELWRKDLLISTEYIRANTVRSIWAKQEILGFFAIAPSSPALLDHLWLLPAAIGKGVGKRALAEIKILARNHGLHELIIISDPNAEAFYLHHGAKRIGEHPSTPQNRMLPKLSLPIP